MFRGQYVWLGLFGISFAVAACSTQDGESGGGDDAGSESEDDGVGQNSQGNEEFTCCINDVGYTCPDKATFDQCLGFDIQECTMACAFGDSACKNACFDQWSASEPNPDGCEADPNADCSTSSGTCGGTAIPCDQDLDCCEGLVCGPRQDGQPGGSCQ
ncbi:MAG: hypothetical protein JNL21_08850 [Myxococcales bacterium]|nr:hypothetical protein [Myxococcales bacterium]